MVDMILMEPEMEISGESLRTRARFEGFLELLKPLKELEDLRAEKDRAVSLYEESRATIDSALVTPFASAIGGMVGLAIPFLVIFYIVLNVVEMSDGRDLFHAYDEWCVTRALFSWYGGILETLGDSTGAIMLKFVLLLLGYLVFPCITVLLPILLVFTTVATVWDVARAKQMARILPDRIRELEDSVAILEAELEEPLKLVSMDYRYSEAVEHFCRSYFNGKVTSLKEAIRLYDYALEKQREEERHQENLEMQRNVINTIKRGNESNKEGLREVFSKLDSLWWKR